MHYEKIMRSMPRRFNSVVISIEESVTQPWEPFKPMKIELVRTKEIQVHKYCF